MEQEQDLIDRERIRKACEMALEKPDQLPAVLEAIYCEGFPGDVDAAEMAPVFAKRGMMMFDELKCQLSAGAEDQKAWLETQKAETMQSGKDAQLMASGACALVASLHKSSDAAYATDLAQRLDMPFDEARIDRMLDTYMDAPLQDWFLTWRNYPLLDEQVRKNAACILAMLTYCDIKSNEGPEMAPDVSFDAVCILCGAVTEVLCRPEEDVQNEEASGGPKRGYAQTVAVVAGLLCTRYLWLDTIVVCVGCICSLVRGIKLIHRKLSKILRGMESVDAGHIRLETEKQGYDFDKHWDAFLRPVEEGGTAGRKNREERKARRHETDYE